MNLTLRNKIYYASRQHGPVKSGSVLKLVDIRFYKNKWFGIFNTNTSSEKIKIPFEKIKILQDVEMAFYKKSQNFDANFNGKINNKMYFTITTKNKNVVYKDYFNL